jgi:protein-S-isoprenylcysteine O-methyltransferase Ste14
MSPVRVRSAAFSRLFSWTGALLFVLSLAYFLVAYLTRFGASARNGDAGWAVAWNVTLFTVFALHHSIFAREPIRRWMARVAAPDLERSVYVWAASLLFLLVCAGWRPVAGVAWSADGIVVWLLRGVQAAALWLILRSAAILDIWELAGIRRPKGLRLPMPSQSEAVAGGLQPSGEYGTTGPYGWVRHPIYLGWFLFVFAASPMTMTRLVFAIVSGAYLLVAIPFEERTMRAISGGAYDRYMAAVRWKLLPGLY